VTKEKKENLLRFELERRRRLELVFSCCQSGMNYLKVCQLGVIPLLCIWIGKAIVFLRWWSSSTQFLEFQLMMIFMTLLLSIWVLEGKEKCGLVWVVLKRSWNGWSECMHEVNVISWYGMIFFFKALIY